MVQLDLFVHYTDIYGVIQGAFLLLRGGPGLKFHARSFIGILSVDLSSPGGRHSSPDGSCIRLRSAVKVFPRLRAISSHTPPPASYKD